MPRAFAPLLAPRRYKGAHGGRGSGKSHFFAGNLIKLAAERPGLRVACLREIQNSLKQSVKRLLEDKIAAFDVGSQFRVMESEIRTPGGGLVIFQGMQNHTAESIKSLEGFHVGWVEEAQSLSQRSLDILIPTFREDESELWFSWNPRNSTDPIDRFLRGNGGHPNATVVEANWTDNPWFPEVLRQDMEWDRANRPEKYQHVWAGQYQVISEAQVFRNWRVEEFETPEDARFYFGADWGFSIDPSVLVRCWIDGRTLYVDQEAYQIGVEVDYLPFLFGGCSDTELQAKNREAWESMPVRYKGWRGIPGARKWPMIADSARPETVDYLKRHGFPRIKSAKKGAGSVEEGVEFLRSFDVVVHPRCKNTADELATYAYKTDRLTGEVIPVLEDKSNHVIDALRYAVENVRRASGPRVVNIPAIR